MMLADPHVDEWLIHPPEPGASVRQHVIYHAMGILRLRYPAPRGTPHAVHPDALKTYGPRLWETLHNIITEVFWSGKSARILIRWTDDGAPELKMQSRLIIDGRDPRLLRN